MTSIKTTPPNRLPARAFQVLLACIVVVGFGLRWWTVQATVLDGAIRSDAIDYVSYTANLAASGVYSSDSSVLRNEKKAREPKADAKRPPGYPLFLGAFFEARDLGGFVLRVQRAQVLLGTAVILLAGLLARLAMGQWLALAVALLTALSPHLIVYTPYLLTETLFSLVVIATLLAIAGALALHRRKRAALGLAGLGGALLGLACLVRPTLDQMAWAALFLVAASPAVRRHADKVMVVFVAFALVMGPWWLRNLSLPDGAKSHAAAITVHQGSYPDMMRKGDPTTFGYPYRGDPATPVVESSLGAALGDLLQKFKDDPLPMARWFLVGKPMALFAWQEQSGWFDMFEYPVLRTPWLQRPLLLGLMSAMVIIHFPLLMFGLAGTALAFTSWTRQMFSPGQVLVLQCMALVHAYFVLVHMAALPLSRYSVPFRPLSYLMAVFALAWLARIARRKIAAYRAGASGGDSLL